MKTSVVVPELDPGFVPAALWNRRYRELAEKKPSHPIAITVERANGAVSRFDTVILEETPENAELNLRYVERLVKFMLWAYGGWHVTVAGAPKAAATIQRTGEAFFGTDNAARSSSASSFPRRMISFRY